MTGTSIEQIVDEMTLAEQVALLSGEDFWSLPCISRLGLGKLRVTDGPNGARGGGSLIGGVKSASFPVGIALGATWNPDLVREIGGALAEETKSKGAHVLLGPTINIHRSVTARCRMRSAKVITSAPGLQSMRSSGTRSATRSVR